MAKKIALEWSENAGALDNARAQLPMLAGDYFRAGRKLLGGKHSAKTMHKLRLRTKHFRYTLELFREVYGKSLEKRLELLKPLQDALGDLNDCATTLDLLGDHAPRVRSYLKKRSKEKIAKFEDYWRGTFDAPGQSEAWADYLGTN
ncbi:MAG: hypothetical protein JWO80_1994 [Bryobacterales bacterium]|nr:hypothetical protein [Bryobacterales bacterium]